MCTSIAGLLVWTRRVIIHDGSAKIIQIIKLLGNSKEYYLHSGVLRRLFLTNMKAQFHFSLAKQNDLIQETTFIFVQLYTFTQRIITKH